MISIVATKEQQHVVVVGAGLAGLSCASHLARRGCKVTVLEARDRLGGRVFTLRDWQGDYHVEGGAEFIDSHHRHVIHYARHFGLALRKLTLWDRLPEESPGVKKFWDSLREISRRVRSPRKPWPFSPELAALDRVSLSQWCEHLQLDSHSTRELELWCWGTECADPATLSTLGLIVEQRQRPRAPFPRLIPWKRDSTLWSTVLPRKPAVGEPWYGCKPLSLGCLTLRSRSLSAQPTEASKLTVS